MSEMRQAKQVCREMIIGLGIWTIPVLILLVVITGQPLAAAAGTLLGALVAVGMIWHMYRHLDIALDMDPKHAQRHTQLASFQRLFVMAAVMAVAFLFSSYLHPLGVILGLFGIKVSALIYPVLHKQLEKRK